MVIDVHVHTSACTQGHGSMSEHLQKTLPFRFMRWRLGLRGYDADTECALARKLVDTLDATEKLDAAVVLAFDAVHDGDGRMDEANTHFYVTNDYVAKLAKQHRKVLFGASVHPYRKDAAAEVERCVGLGAVLLKWLPIVQNFNPADPRCLPVYEALAHHKLPLLCHTGGETALPNLDESTADPMLLKPALERGVTVIMAHCGTRSKPSETDYLEQFLRCAREYEHCYGDTSALNLPMRSHAYEAILKDKVVREKLVHGSDWPIMPIPPATMIGVRAALGLWLTEGNWMRRDVLIKERLGFDDAYWHRAGKILKLSGARERADAGAFAAT